MNDSAVEVTYLENLTFGVVKSLGNMTVCVGALLYRSHGNNLLCYSKGQGKGSNWDLFPNQYLFQKSLSPTS